MEAVEALFDLPLACIQCSFSVICLTLGRRGGGAWICGGHQLARPVDAALLPAALPFPLRGDGPGHRGAHGVFAHARRERRGVEGSFHFLGVYKVDVSPGSLLSKSIALGLSLLWGSKRGVGAFGNKNSGDRQQNRFWLALAGCGSKSGWLSGMVRRASPPAHEPWDVSLTTQSQTQANRLLHRSPVI